MTSESLKELFEQHGEVTSAKVILDKYTQKSRGFGFVEMPNDNEGEAAIQNLHGHEIEGRNLVVRKALNK